MINRCWRRNCWRTQFPADAAALPGQADRRCRRWADQLIDNIKAFVAGSLKKCPHLTTMTARDEILGRVRRGVARPDFAARRAASPRWQPRHAAQPAWRRTPRRCRCALPTRRRPWRAALNRWRRGRSAGGSRALSGKSRSGKSRRWRRRTWCAGLGTGGDFGRRAYRGRCRYGQDFRLLLRCRRNRNAAALQRRRTPATVSLLPETHIALVPVARLVATMEDALPWCAPNSAACRER